MNADQIAEIDAACATVREADKALTFIEIYSSAFELAVKNLSRADLDEATELLAQAGLDAGLTADKVQAEITDGLADGRKALAPTPAVVVPAVPAAVPAPAVMPTSRAGRREIAMRALTEHPLWSNRRLARECGISDKTISKLRTCETPQLRLGLDGRWR